LVEETLEPLDPDRRAFRLVGGVLVERTVKEVLPSVKQNRDNLEQVIATMDQRLTVKQKETAEFKAKYNIVTTDQQ
jgi:prefoldin subunit 2